MNKNNKREEKLQRPEVQTAPCDSAECYERRVLYETPFNYK